MFRKPSCLSNSNTCFPRVCGDVPQVAIDRVAIGGFSPRMRGCSFVEKQPVRARIVFPAYAGMFRVFHAHLMPSKGFPRACGDVPSRSRTTMSTSTFSPRMRGCSGSIMTFFELTRVFPAYAGMFLEADFLDICKNRFPRVCGDVPPRSRTTMSTSTFSPRMRGCS